VPEPELGPTFPEELVIPPDPEAPKEAALAEGEPATGVVADPPAWVDCAPNIAVPVGGATAAFSATPRSPESPPVETEELVEDTTPAESVGEKGDACFAGASVGAGA